MTERKFIPICTPHLTEEVIQEVVKTLRSGWLGQTPRLFKFEEEFRKMGEFKYAIAVNSCTSSLRLALHLAGVGPNDEVITTPNTFVATNTAILEQFAKPVFADIKYSSGNIYAWDMEEKITKKTKAIMIVHFMGYPCDLDSIYGIADTHNIPVIEDAAQAVGATYQGESIGSREYGCFSFQVVKQITTGDGGMFTTNNEDIYESALRASWFGFTKKERSNSARTGVCNYDIPEVGFKYRMNAINASMGLAQLPYLPTVLVQRRLKAELYRTYLEDVDGVDLFEDAIWKKGACYMFPIHVERRPQFLKMMKEAKIEAFVHNFRNDRFSVFGGQQDLPNMKRFDETYVCLPLHHEVSIEDIHYITYKIGKGW